MQAPITESVFSDVAGSCAQSKKRLPRYDAVLMGTEHFLDRRGANACHYRNVPPPVE